MAALLNTRAPATRTYASPVPEAARAQGYLNFFINRPDGTRESLGKSGIALNDAITAQRNLRAWLKEDIDGNLAKLLSCISIEYYDVADAAAKAFDYSQLGAKPAPEKK